MRPAMCSIANAPPGFSAALVPYLDGVGMKKEGIAEDRLTVTKDPATRLYGRRRGVL